MRDQVLGIDVGAESVKLVALRRGNGAFEVVIRRRVDHHKDPHSALRAAFDGVDLGRVASLAVTGRLGRVVAAPQVPTKGALRRGVRALHGELDAVTVIGIGAHGFMVLEVLPGGVEWFQQNSRCSQGTGNFLTQLVERFGLSIEAASELCDHEPRPAPLSGRCPVILKTDMTHLANQGESRSRILAGLYDAVAENVVTLVRPRLAPRRVVLVGGVARSARIRRTIGKWLAERGMELVAPRPDDGFLEAVGAATHALEAPAAAPPGSLEALLVNVVSAEIERVPPLSGALARVRRLARWERATDWASPREVLVGLDIGSTGSKAVAVDAVTGSGLWEAYLATEGAPVRAAQRLLERWQQEVGGRGVVRGFGVTGSGREIVGSLLRTAYGPVGVFVLNEIAAHARGAVEFDPEVDTIFEIGGQDAKYIRLEAGRVTDAAMNEACSAGTGSFIAEQGAKLDGGDPRELGERALRAGAGVSLGQHCSVFMAEVMDEAITQGIDRDAIIAGLFDSVIQNYLNRVKGSRTVGRRIFCQGMPFSSDALAAAVARQTGATVVVPPNPGTIGALGIALLARDEGIASRSAAPLDPTVFLGARVRARDTFVCRSVEGCGEPGNRCRIDRLVTEVNGLEQRFLWGGSCSKYDRGSGRRRLPDGMPDPFRDRERLVDAVLAAQPPHPGAPVIAFSDEFVLKGHTPLFAAFFAGLGFRIEVARRAGAALLKRGIEGGRVPYCAPMQLFHGVVFSLVDARPDILFLPLVRSIPRVDDADYGELCPIVLGSPDIVGGVLPPRGPRVLRSVVDFDAGGYQGKRFAASMRAIAEELGRGAEFEAALGGAVAAQEGFERDCRELGRTALLRCAETGVVPVVVQGRPYTVYNDVLNSNVPNLLRSLGALAIPLDCYPIDEPTPSLPSQYWGYTQRNLQAAHVVRRTPGVYSVFCSNYACGPDSFGLHFFAYAMQGKPFTIIETDGHSGDAGTKTRLEAFLYCVDGDLKSGASRREPATDFSALDARRVDWAQTQERRARVLIPRMSENAEVAAAALRAEGYRAEALPLTTREDVRVGRQHTSGKECVPMMITLGAMLNRVRSLESPAEPVTFFMPTTHGPCRFGVYGSLHKLTLERLGLAERVGLVSPDETDYFAGMSAGFSAKLWIGFAVHDLLEAMLLYVRPVEREPGVADVLFQRSFVELCALMDTRPAGSLTHALGQLATGMWGTRALLRRAAAAFAAQVDPGRHAPTVAVVGEIYVRLDPFANDHLVRKLEARGLRVRFAPFTEWLEYTTFLGEERVAAGTPTLGDHPLATPVKGLIQRVSSHVLHGIAARALGWGPRTTVEETLDAARPFVDPRLEGEATLTLGGPLHEYRTGRIHGAVIVGPHECMPCKVAEAQYGKVVETSPFPYLAVGVNGDPIDSELLDRFAYDVHQICDRDVRPVTRAGMVRASVLPVVSPTVACEARACSGCRGADPGAVGVLPG
ncbi:MAG: CoA activase [Polyangiaceae bacterium]|nr:CoA activase [Polyangiaceae bacterium]